MADFVVPRHSAVMERLRRRIELFRLHHSSCESRYDNTAMERLEIERQHTFTLHQRCLQTKAKRASKHRQAQPASDQTGLRGAGTGGSSTEMTDGGPAEQSRNSTLIALQETVKRKLENVASPLNGDQANGFGDGYSAAKKLCIEDALVGVNGTSSKHVRGGDKPNGNHSMNLGKNGGGGPESGLGGNRESENCLRIKEFKQEPMDDDLPGMLPPGGSMSNNNLFPDLNLNEQEWKELMEEFNRSVAYEDMQDIFNEGFEDRKDSELPPSSAQTSVPQDSVNIKVEYSPAPTTFEQESRTGSPRVRSTSSGPPVHTNSPASTARTASSPAMPTSQPPSQPQRQIPQTVMLPGPSTKDLSPAQQLQQLAAQRMLNQQQAQKQQQQQQQQQQQAQKFHQSNHQSPWPQSASSQSPLGGAYGMEKPTSPSLYQQDFSNSKQLMVPNLPNKSSPKAGGGSYLQGGGLPNMLGHPPNNLTQNPVSSQPPLLDYNNTKPLSHYEVDQSQRGTPPAPNKHAILSLQPQQRHLTEEQKRLIKQKTGLPFCHVPPQDQTSAQAAPHIAGSVPTAGMGAQPPTTAMAGNHGNTAYHGNQAAVMKQQQQQQQMQLMEQQKQYFMGQRQLMAEQEKQRQQQEQQLKRHLTRPPPQYQDQQNPFQAQQQVNQFQGSNPALANVGNLGVPNNGTQRMFPQTQGIMPLGVGQTGGPSSAPSATSQNEMVMPACSGLESVQPVMYNNMGSGMNQMHPHSAQQSSVNNAQLQRQTVAMAPNSTISGAYRQGPMAGSGLAAQQHHKGPANPGLMKQQIARMPNSMSAQPQSWPHQGMQGMNNQTPGGNGGLAAFNNPGFHMPPRHPKMPNQQFAQAGLSGSRPMPAMNSAQPQQQSQPVVSNMSQPVPDLTNFGQAQNPQLANRASLHCSQGYQVNRTTNQELSFGYNAQSGTLSSFPGDGDLMDTLLKSRTTQEWMDDLDELLANHH
ncbi:MAML1 protein, partial [Atractosteus spatula]|nr:MAML1 protein [Atractosteus spatula]